MSCIGGPAETNDFDHFFGDEPGLIVNDDIEMEKNSWVWQNEAELPFKNSLTDSKKCLK